MITGMLRFEIQGDETNGNTIKYLPYVHVWKHYIMSHEAFNNKRKKTKKLQPC